MRVIGHGFKIGDEVSYCFNGDSYHDGVVQKITAKRLWTSNGHGYSLTHINWRDLIKDEAGNTIDVEDCKREVFKSMYGGTWALIPGHIHEWNPEF